MSTTPPIPPTKPKWGRIGSVVRRTSGKFAKHSGKAGSDGDSDTASLRQTPSFEVMKTTPPLNFSPSPPTTPPSKSKVGRIGRAVRRASTKFSHQGTPSAERDSDSISLKRTPSYEASPPTTPSLSVPAMPVEATLPSPIAESPARETEAIQREIVGPSPLAQLSFPQEAEVSSAHAEAVASHIDVEGQTSSGVEHLASSVVNPFSGDLEAPMHAAEHDISSDTNPGSENGEASIPSPMVDAEVPVNPPTTDIVSTSADEESLVVVDSSVVETAIFVADFNESLRDAVVPGALPLTPNTLFYPDRSPNVEIQQDDESASELEGSTYPEMAASTFLQIELPSALVEVPSSTAETFHQTVVPVVHEQQLEGEQVTITRQTENASAVSFEDFSVSNPLTISEASKVALPVVVDDNIPAPTPAEKKNTSLDIYPVVPPASIISQPPPAYTVDHFPSPNSKSHLVAGPEKAAGASRPTKKEATPSSKSVTKPSRPTNTVSATNSAYGDFRVKTLMVVVGAMAGIVATAMLLLRR